MAGKYRAILIGNSSYPADEHNLQTLKGPVKDIAALNRALVDGAAGLFDDLDVTLLAETSSARAVKALGKFFGSAERDDVLLLYFSGHGKLDQSGRLHLCMQDTETTDLLSTAVSSTRINEFVDASRARNVVIILDCCYAGAYRGSDFGDAVAGPGRYVLTSCRGTQLANDATVENSTSYFTQHLIEGLLGAATDRDQDGYVDFSDLYSYVDRQLREEGKQIPQRRVIGDGDLRLARHAYSPGTPQPIASHEPPERLGGAQPPPPPPASVQGAPAPPRKNRVTATVRQHRRATLLIVLAALCAAGSASFIALQNPSRPAPPPPRFQPAHDATDLSCDGYDDFLAVERPHNLVLWRRQASATTVMGTQWEFQNGHNYAYPVNRRFDMAYTSLVLPGDLNGDGKPDVVGQKRDGSLWLMAGTCQQDFGFFSVRKITTDTGRPVIDRGQLAGVGDLTGDTRPDLVSVRAGQLFLYAGMGGGNLSTGESLGSGWTAALPAGDVNGDGYPDVLNRDSEGLLHLFLSDGKSGWRDTPASGLTLSVKLPPQEYPAVIGGARIYATGSQPDLTAITAEGGLVVFQATDHWPQAPYKYGCTFGNGWSSDHYLLVADAVPPGGRGLPTAPAHPRSFDCR